MAIDRMQKVAIFGLAEEFAAISHGLQRLSMLHITHIEGQDVRTDDGGQTLAEADAALARVHAAIDFLSAYNANKRGLLTPKPEMTEEELSQVDDAQNWRAVDEATKLREQLAEQRALIAQWNNTLSALAPYEQLDAKVGDIRPTAHVYMVLGTVPQAGYAEFAQQAQALGALVEQIGETGDVYTVFAAVHRDQQEALTSLLRTAGFADANLPVKGRVKEEQARLREDVQRAQLRMAQLGAEALTLSQSMEKLQWLYDYCSIRQQRAALALESGRTEKTFVLTGWVRERQVKKLQAALQKLSDAVYLEQIEPEEGELPPTAMRNGRFLKPFEAVTDMYAALSPYEADPTWIMAPFFLCFFGMMVSDAGYGIVLTILAALFMKIARPRGMMGQIVAIVTLGGVVTVLWGTVFGSWFGESLLPPIWFSPLEEPMMMLGLCLGLGMVHLTTGILMRAVALIKAHQIWDALFDCGLILGILWGAVCALLGVHGALTVVLICVLGVFLTAGRDRKNLIGKFTGGFSAVYNLTGYLSDVLSYSRLFGMGLATGVIGMVFNTIASLLTTSWIGWPFALIILVAGHGFNIAVNTMGAYVHACRLQYIEFYDKFFEGGGRTFVPYAYKTKYIVLISPQ